MRGNVLVESRVNAGPVRCSWCVDYTLQKTVDLPLPKYLDSKLHITTRWAIRLTLQRFYFVDCERNAGLYYICITARVPAVII